MTDWIKLCDSDQLPPKGKSRAFAVDMDPPENAGPLYLKSLKDGRNRVAVYNTEKGLFAIDDRCPHLEAPLVDGKVHRGTVTCAWHFWQFELENGHSLVSSKMNVRAYELDQRGKEVYLRLITIADSDEKAGGESSSA